MFSLLNQPFVSRYYSKKKNENEKMQQPHVSFSLDDCNGNTCQAQVISTSKISGKNSDGLTSETTKYVTPITNDLKPVVRKEVRTPQEDLNSPKTGPPYLPLRKPVAASTPAVPLARKHCTSSVTTPIDCRSLASMGDTTPQQDNYSVIPEGDVSHSHTVLLCKKLNWSHQHFEIQTGVAFFDWLISIKIVQACYLCCEHDL